VGDSSEFNIIIRTISLQHWVFDQYCIFSQYNFLAMLLKKQADGIYKLIHPPPQKIKAPFFSLGGKYIWSGLKKIEARFGLQLARVENQKKP